MSTRTPARRPKPDVVQGMNKPPARRRTQAERSADTRSRLIQAAITCLYRTGYSATTITTVADEAGVSRGAMTHQFPAKTDLMLAVVQSVFEDDGNLYNAAVASMRPRQWLQSLPQTMWNIISRPSGIAVMEIMLASRSDPDLAKKLRALQTEIDKRAHQWSAERVGAADVPLHPEANAIHEVYVAAVRGLALRATFMNNDAGVQKSLKVLSDMMRLLYHDHKRQN
jgi:AcrR family transcriptional regulator